MKPAICLMCHFLAVYMLFGSVIDGAVSYKLHKKNNMINTNLNKCEIA